MAPPARSDAELLREFVETNSDDVFAQIVSRHANWVYSAAFRQMRDCAAAEDVTQVVFAILARKAASLRGETLLSGWLFRVVRYTAIDAMRMEIRRRQREEAAGIDLHTSSEPPDARWEEVAPVVDECLANLRPTDQRAILLRFFEQKSWRDVGAALGMKENAARVRVERALEKLRGTLRHRGVVSSVAGLSALLLANCVQAAPASMALAGSSSTVATLVRSVIRRFLIRKVVIASAVACVVATCVSFFVIPKSQNGYQLELLGPAAYQGLVEVDRALWQRDADQFIAHVYFRDARDEAFRPTLREFALAWEEFGRVGSEKYRNQPFGYYEMLDIILAGRARPLEYGRSGNRAWGSFSKSRGVEFMEVDGAWKWNFFADLPAERLDEIAAKAKLLRQLTQAIRDGASAEEVIAELRRR